MSDFRTTLNVSPSPDKINLRTPVLSLGSCFADTMGQRLVDHKFPALNNPFGVLFNPISLATVLGQVINRRLPREEHYLQSEGLWRHFDLHSDFAHPDLMVLEEAIQNTWIQTYTFLEQTEWLLLTLGTTTTYTNKDTKQVVANCHKVPTGHFEKGMLTVAEVQAALSFTLDKLWELNPKVKVVLTVSPVRHLKDTLPVNSVSKATLRVAAEELKQRYPEQVHYFPAYELVMDDLRDYRFYAEDMLHLSSTAHDYVWEKFASAYLDESATTFWEAWEQIRRDMAHRARNPEGEAHQAFLQKLLEKVSLWADVVDVSAERKAIEKQLK